MHGEIEVEGGLHKDIASGIPFERLLDQASVPAIDWASFPVDLYFCPLSPLVVHVAPGALTLDVGKALLQGRLLLAFAFGLCCELESKDGIVGNLFEQVLETLRA